MPNPLGVDLIQVKMDAVHEGIGSNDRIQPTSRQYGRIIAYSQFDLRQASSSHLGPRYKGLFHRLHSLKSRVTAHTEITDGKSTTF